MKKNVANAAEQQALIVTLKLPSGGDVERFYALEDKLSAAIAKASAGEFDGDEFGEGSCTLYMYGTSADRLFAITFEILNEWQPCQGSYLIKRFGKPGAREERFELGSGK